MRRIKSMLFTPTTTPVRPVSSGDKRVFLSEETGKLSTVSSTGAVEPVSETSTSDAITCAKWASVADVTITAFGFELDCTSLPVQGGTGLVFNLPRGCVAFRAAGATSSAFSLPAPAPETLQYICPALTLEEGAGWVNSVLVALAGYGTENGTVDLSRVAELPSGDGLTAVTTLRSRGWEVTLAEAP